MSSTQRIGHPSCGEYDNHKKIVGTFDLPTSEQCNSGTGFVQCLITRVGNNCYHFSHQIEGTMTVSMIGTKLKSSRTSNYHIFDAVRGGTNAKLSKKSGHYIGKLRHDKDMPRGCYTLYDNSIREKQELAAFVYDIPALVQQVKEGQPPRKMQAIVPKSILLDANKDPHIAAAKKGTVDDQIATNSRLIEHLHNGTWKHQKLLVVQTKPPKFHEGQYRLNFNGRVQTPSVKNMQLENEQGEILLQFGKVNGQRFHLDYKAPFTAFSAFGAALCQFDM